MEEKIFFNIIRITKGGDSCRIEAQDIRSKVREIASGEEGNLIGGGVISDLEVLLDELSRIHNETKEKFNAEAVFNFIEPTY
ncbi:MAG: hypothetical protein J6M62_02540 [Selenomonadaceae bacterium]|nr:hypothetical protein [Selenomonadaceae bacterium]MBP3723804.1 hypothetical protein [Selenomonadaceae bacterium]MBR3722308.1 hypothetical protein [Selenomonadaceae bacterium]